MIDEAWGPSNEDEKLAPARSEADSLESTNRRPSTLQWVANIGYAAVLVVMALLPSTSVVSDLSVPDWLAHAIAYGIQSVLVYWASLPMLDRRRALAVGVVTASTFGVLTEGLQLLQPGRSVEFKDLVANTAGALLMCGVVAGVSGLRTGPRP